MLQPHLQKRVRVNPNPKKRQRRVGVFKNDSISILFACSSHFLNQTMQHITVNLVLFEVNLKNAFISNKDLILFRLLTPSLSIWTNVLHRESLQQQQAYTNTGLYCSAFFKLLMRLKFNKYRQYNIFACLNQRVHVENCSFLGRRTSFSKPLCMITRHFRGKNSSFVSCFEDTGALYFAPVEKVQARGLQDRMQHIQLCGYYPEKHFIQHVKTMGQTQFVF